MPGPSNVIGGEAHPVPGEVLVVRDPAEPARVVFSCSPQIAHVGHAVDAARRALPAWSGLPREKRYAVLRRFAAISKAGIAEMATLISTETGKALWECKAEAGLLAGKVDITLDTAPEGGLQRVTDFEMPLSVSRTGRCIFKPHGVMAVVGPFNFPAHLPNGHIVPALAAGNTVVFKPSDKAPGTGQLLCEWFIRAIREELGDTAEGRLCAGAVNLIHGGGDVAAALTSHAGIDGVLFTGSWPVAKRIQLANIDRPGRILAFELGGSNPAVVMDDADVKLAALEVARSAFNTTGQRCTCTRRLIVHESVERKLIALVGKIASNLIIGHPRPPAGQPVFSGPIISRAALDAVLNFQSAAAKSGASIVMQATAIDSETNGHFVSPCILRVDRFTADPLDHAVSAGETVNPGADVEVFGPLLRYTTVRSLDEAIEQTNATRYGLAASIFTASPESGERFIREVRAGCININTGTAGASSKLPFGGLGLSGNHRPAGSFALDYCASPVACMVERSSTPPALSEGMRFDDTWLA